MRFEFEAQTYEFRGVYRWPKRDDYFLSGNATVLQGGIGGGIRAIVHRISRRHTFTGVVWEEGEFRLPVIGEVFIYENGDPAIAVIDFQNQKYRMLHPVAFVGQEGE